MTKPAGGDLPSLHLLLTPKATESGHITTLQFSLTAKRLPHQAGDLLCTYTQHQHDDAASSQLQRLLRGIRATLTDGDGALPFTLSGQEDEDDGRQEIYVAREARGDIVFSSEIRALGVDEPARDASALRRDQGGILGAGRYFLPWFTIDGNCRLSIEWELANCPEGTRAVCSLGEGPESVEALGHSKTVLDCVFMVGPIKSNLLEEALQGTGNSGAGCCGTYWFGDLPGKLDAVKDFASSMFPRMSEHFKDEGGSYHAFFRRVSNGLQSGTFHSSAIIDYDTDVEDDHDWDIIRVLNRAMVTAWVQLDPEDDGNENCWFTDGLALLYTVYLPFSFGQRGPDDFRATVNTFLSAYYANPLISEPLKQLQALSHQNSWYAASAKSTRAFVYMLKMDTYTRRAAVARDADILRPIDEVVGEICSRRRLGEKMQKNDWIGLIASWISRGDAEKHFREMMEDGRLIELDDMVFSFGSTYGPQLVDQEPLEFGFGRESLTTGVVTSVMASSRAYEAGLRKGDRIMWHSRLEICELHRKETFKLLLWRKGKPSEIEYLPRAKGTVRCWQVMERPSPLG